MKFWVKAYNNEKLILNILEIDTQPITAVWLEALLRQLCDEHDLPTPIVTEINAKNLISFNHTQFKQCDFLESINFDYLEVSRYK